eukprot:1193520-Prorocentrum_minimum.AAC.4
MLPRPITPAGFLPAAAAISKGFVDPDLTHSDAVVERMVENRTLEVGQQRAIIKYVSQELTAFDYSQSDRDEQQELLPVLDTQLPICVEETSKARNVGRERTKRTL